MEKHDRQFNRLIEKPVEIFKFHPQKKIKILLKDLKRIQQQIKVTSHKNNTTNCNFSPHYLVIEFSLFLLLRFRWHLFVFKVPILIFRPAKNSGFLLALF